MLCLKSSLLLFLGGAGGAAKRTCVTLAFIWAKVCDSGGRLNCVQKVLLLLRSKGGVRGVRECECVWVGNCCACCCVGDKQRLRNIPHTGFQWQL